MLTSTEAAMRISVSSLIVALLVCISGLLLLTSVQKLRLTAQRMRCVNNLRQTGLALQNYAETHERFPQTGIAAPGLAPEKRLSWLLEIIPFMESTDLHSRLNLNDGWDAEQSRHAGLYTPYFWQCPSFAYGRPTSTLSPSHYVGITGVGPDAASLPVEDPRAGFFGDERKIGVGDLPFGTSSMLVAVETTHVEGSWTAGGQPTSRALLEDSPLNGVDAQFGGLHPGGANALFADASVRFWRGSLDESLIRKMATIHGREGVEPIPTE